MKGVVKLKRINKRTGETDVLFEDENQVTTGLGHTIVNVLTGQGSRNIEDYQVGYFQLGSEAYDLNPEFNDFGMSADVGVSANIPYFWTLKGAFSESDYGSDGVLAVVKRRQYGFGSYVPSGSPTTALFSNFIQPPETTKTNYDYADRFYLTPPGEPMPPTSSIVVAGCANAWEGQEGNSKQNEHPMYTDVRTDVSGPDNQIPTFKIFYNPDRSLQGLNSSCLRPGTGYVYFNGKRPDVWGYAKPNTSQSYYWRPIYYASSDGDYKSSVLTTINQIFNRSAQSYVGNGVAGQNRVIYKAIYDLTTDDSIYTPIITEASSGYEKCVAANNCDVSVWEKEFGRDGGGVVSGNVGNRFGYIYTYKNSQGLQEDGSVCPGGPYACFDGPGAPYMTQASAGFGPDGQWFRLTMSWNNVPSGVVDYRRDGGAVLQPMITPMYQNIKSVTECTVDCQGPLIDQRTGVTEPSNNHNRTPREAAFIADYQYEENKTPTAKQRILGEKPYYITDDAHFVKIPRSYTTSLNEDTCNIRLLVDENMAVGQTIKEIGLFTKNPNGSRGVDQPYLVAYKALSEPITKNDEFSYIVDWELSVISG